MEEQFRRALEDELRGLDAKVAQMGGLVELSLAQAIDALHDHDPELAARTLDIARSVGRHQRLIEETAISLTSRRQPVADDLRRIIAAIRVAADLERIGDLAKNIAKRAIAVAEQQHPKQLMQGFMHIGESALRQMKDVLDAYSQRDAEKARKVWLRDDDIDAMYNSLYFDLLAATRKEPGSVELYAHLLFGAKNLERIGDHATNIAATIYFLVHGGALEEERSSTGRVSHLLPL